MTRRCKIQDLNNSLIKIETSGGEGCKITGGGVISIFLLSAFITFHETIVFTVSEHEHMNPSITNAPTIIELAPILIAIEHNYHM